MRVAAVRAGLALCALAATAHAAPAIPDSSYGPIWCAWGYERNFTAEQVYGTLPKAKEDRKSTRLNSSHSVTSRMPSSA